MTNFVNQSVAFITGSGTTSAIGHSCVVNYHAVFPIIVDARIGKVRVAKCVTPGIGVNEQIAGTKATILLECGFEGLFIIIEPSIILMIGALHQGELKAMGCKRLVQSVHTTRDLALGNLPSAIGFVEDHEMGCHIDCLQLAAMVVCEEFRHNLVVLHNLFM